MRLFDVDMKPLDRSQIDLSNGYLSPIIVIKENALPVDNKNKFAWEDDDYENAEMYVVNEIRTTTPDDDRDRMLVDYEYRLTVLELGL